jgi:hypothetical protein
MAHIRKNISKPLKSAKAFTTPNLLVHLIRDRITDTMGAEMNCTLKYALYGSYVQRSSGLEAGLYTAEGELVLRV